MEGRIMNGDILEGAIPWCRQISRSVARGPL